MERLEKAIEEERVERIADLKSQLTAINDDLSALRQGFADQTKNRISKEAKVLSTMADGSAKIMTLLTETKDLISKQRSTLKNDIEKAVDGIDEKFVDFTTSTKDRFNDVREEWENEIDEMEQKVRNASLKLAKMNMQTLQ